MKEYKLSRYNNIFIRNGSQYLWNTFSGALIKMNTEAMSYYKNFPNNDDGSDFFKILFENGCVVKNSLDELGKVLYDEKAIMLDKSPDRLYFTIAPGLDCNYACEYCFENSRTSFEIMSEDTQERLYQYLCKRMLNNRYLKRISITWFGGEPLLHTDIIYSLSKKLIAFCERHNIQYYAGIISNGRYLTYENVQLLRECHIGHIQISIDGMEEIYCKNKNCNSSDFYATVENLCYAVDYFPIAVRINVIDGNIKEACKLTEYLLITKHLDKKVKVYIAHTRDYEKNLSDEEEQQSHGHFLDSEIEFFNMFGEKKTYAASSIEFRVPKRRGASCLSVCSANACIGPLGEIYQCEHHFGISEAVIGTIDEGFFYQENKSRYITFEHYDKCLKCSFLPVCMGGCLDDKVNCRNMIHCEKYCNRLIDLKLKELNF